jgi:hypothetical protein
VLATTAWGYAGNAKRRLLSISEAKEAFALPTETNTMRMRLTSRLKWMMTREGQEVPNAEVCVRDVELDNTGHKGISNKSSVASEVTSD